MQCRSTFGLDQPIESLGNQFGLVLVCLPVEVHDPLMCFRQVQENMNRLKQSYQAQVTYSLLDLFGRGPDILERRAWTCSAIRPLQY